LRDCDGQCLAGHILAIRDVFPSLDAQSVKVHRGPQRSHILVVNNWTIFKFPQTTSGVEELVRESALLNRLRRRLPLPIPEPLYENLGLLTIGRAWLGYARRPGEPLWRETLLAQSETSRAMIAKQFGKFLEALHAISTENLGVALPIQDTHQTWADLHARIVEKLFPCMRSESRLLVSGHFEPYLEEPGALAHVPVLRHGDFGPTNILFDSSTSGLSGVSTLRALRSAIRHWMWQACWARLAAVTNS
jgi:aminoglycoside 2''-phosphotransferase